MGDLGAQIGVGKAKGNIVGYQGANEVRLVVGNDDVAPIVPHHIPVEFGRVGFVTSELPTEADGHSSELVGTLCTEEFSWQPQQTT